jgi:hypothetical protein
MSLSTLRVVIAYKYIQSDNFIVILGVICEIIQGEKYFNVTMSMALVAQSWIKMSIQVSTTVAWLLGGCGLNVLRNELETMQLTFSNDKYAYIYFVCGYCNENALLLLMGIERRFPR